LNPPVTTNAPATHVRHHVSAWLASAAAIAYLCRSSIAVAEKTIRTDLELTEAEMGMILGPAFFWAYALAQIPAGSLGERFGSRRTMPILSVAWSLATACSGIAGSAASLIAARVGMGLAQAGLFPCSTNSIAHWHPQTGRAFASGMLGAFMSVGGAIGVSLTGVLLVHLDWRWIFGLYSLPGMIWAIGFFVWFRDRPADHGAANLAEQAFIRAGQAELAERSVAPAGSAAMWLALATSPAMWMIASQQFFRAAGYIFFASWFPTYLQETRGVSTSESGLLTVGPLVATVCAQLLGGGISDWVFRRTGSLSLARKGVAMTSLSLCACLVFSAFFVADARLAVAIISMGVFCAGFAGPSAYTVTMDMGGQHVASVFATMNMVGNFGAALMPWLVPYFRAAVERSPTVLDLCGQNSWNGVLVLFAVTYVFSAMCWMLLRTTGTVFDQSLISIIKRQ
jgi:sugar phosphate permease